VSPGAVTDRDTLFLSSKKWWPSSAIF